MMEQALQDFLTPRQEEIELAGRTIIVRELGSASDLDGFRDQQDHFEKFIVRSCFDKATGEQLFTDEHIPMLKRAPATKTRGLRLAVARVNGLVADDELKNSDAGPGAGSSST
jgi:hypothetical protein